jgi:hypothetical protein
MDKMVRINWTHHCHEDAVILLNSEVDDITIKVIDNLNTTQTLECTKGKYNVKIIK